MIWCARNLKQVLTSRVTYLILITFACWFYSAYQGLNPDKAIKETAEIFGLTFGGIIIFSALQTHRFNFDTFFKVANAGAALCASWLVLTPWVGEYAVEWGSSYGSVLAVISPMALYCAVTAQKTFLSMVVGICIDCFCYIRQWWTYGMACVWCGHHIIYLLFPMENHPFQI